jgi:hypothetical protein
LEFMELISLPKLLPCEENLADITDIRVTSKLIFCCISNSLLVVLCSDTRRLLKTIRLSAKFTVSQRFNL